MFSPFLAILGLGSIVTVLVILLVIVAFIVVVRAVK